MIDYSIIHNALDFYQEELYTRVEVPWIVSKGISDLTRPTNVHGHDVVKNGRTKTFVGSGEQGFLYLWAKGHLGESGEFVTCTPCMRDDDFDETHLKYFTKVELIKFGKYVDPKKDVERIVRDARKFFEKYVHPSTLKEVETEEGLDLEFHGIEIGSYGVRECILGKWVYGTGVAEPRFSRLMKRFGTT